MRMRSISLLALLAAAVMTLGLGPCAKVKDTATEAKDNVKTHGKDAVDKGKDVVKDVAGKEKIIITVTSPAGATFVLIQGRAWNTQNDQRQEKFRVPFEIRMSVPSTAIFEITYNNKKVYAKIDTLAVTDYAMLNNLKLELPIAVLDAAGKGEAKTAILRDPNTNTPLVKVSLGSKAPEK
jgi:hypothetical protein